MARSFSQDITAFVKKTGVSADEVLRKLAFDAFGGLLRRSPVDTGRFRASWRVAINRIDQTVQPPPATAADEKPGSAYRGSMQAAHATNQAAASGAISKAKFGDSVNISNNLEYAEPLENGHSKQAPQGMLKITFEEIKAAFALTVRQVVGQVST